jgi:glycosyltransferase involved in cell wall biosynthesis
MTLDGARRIVFIVHYFPPINSTGGKRVEALSKYFARRGRRVTVITTVKAPGDGLFSERAPPGVDVIELNWLGRPGASPDAASPVSAVAVGSDSRGALRRVKTAVQQWFGQLPDPRLPFAVAFGSPWLAARAVAALESADVVVSSMPPWPTHLAAAIVRWRFGRRIVMDYRDNFSGNHIMAGSAAAKRVEVRVDRWLARRADGVVVISEPMAEYYRQFSDRVKVVLNGYDAEVFDEVRRGLERLSGRAAGPVTIRYLGRISRDRVPYQLIAALSEAVGSGAMAHADLRFEFYGEAAPLRRFLEESHPHLLASFAFLAPVPYREAVRLMLTADYLLFAETSDQSSLSAKGVLTTKLFEYLACGRPIIAEIHDDTEAGRLIKRAGSTHVVAHTAAAFAEFLSNPARRSADAAVDTSFVRSLSRESQADEYLAFLDADVCGAAA